MYISNNKYLKKYKFLCNTFLFKESKKLLLILNFYYPFSILLNLVIWIKESLEILYMNNNNHHFKNKLFEFKKTILVRNKRFTSFNF